MKRMWMALMLAPALAWAQQGWLYLGDSPLGQIYGREDSLVRPKVGNPVYWVYIDYKAPRNGAMSVRLAVETDCERRQTRIMGGTEYTGAKGSGTVVQPIRAGEWEPVAPGSAMSGIAYRACS